MQATRNVLTPTGRGLLVGPARLPLQPQRRVLLFALPIILAVSVEIDWLKMLLVCLGVVYT